MLKKIYLLLVLFFSITTTGQASDPAVKMNRVSWGELETMATEAKLVLERQAAEYGLPVKLYLHWSAGHYGVFYDDYHINIDADGTLYTSTTDLTKKKHHTHRRNNGSISLAISACFNATPKEKDLGKEPPTQAQIDSMAKAIAVLAVSLGIPIDRNHVMTHGEAADNIDRYFPPYENNNRPYGMYGPLHDSERWDLAILKNGDKWRSGGSALRIKAIVESFHWQKAKRVAQTSLP